MRKLQETIKVDPALYPAAVSANGSTSPYFDMSGFGRALFVWDVILHSAGLTTTSIGTVLQAKDGLGTAAAGLAGSTAILTASPKMIALTITASATLADGNTISLTENNIFAEPKAAIVFTLTAAGTSAVTVLNGVNISATGGGTAIMSNTCTNFAAAINGISGSSLYGSASATTLVIRSRNGGDTVFSFTASNTTGFTIVSAQVQGMIEISAGAMTVSSNFTHLALNIINESGYQTSAVIIRGKPSRQMPIQQCSVLKTV